MSGSHLSGFSEDPDRFAQWPQVMHSRGPRSQSATCLVLCACQESGRFRIPGAREHSWSQEAVTTQRWAGFRRTLCFLSFLCLWIRLQYLSESLGPRVSGCCTVPGPHSTCTTSKDSPCDVLTGLTHCSHGRGRTR